MGYFNLLGWGYILPSISEVAWLGQGISVSILSLSQLQRCICLHIAKIMQLIVLITFICPFLHCSSFKELMVVYRVLPLVLSSQKPNEVGEATGPWSPSKPCLSRDLNLNLSFCQWAMAVVPPCLILTKILWSSWPNGLHGKPTFWIQAHPTNPPLYQFGSSANPCLKWGYF